MGESLLMGEFLMVGEMQQSAAAAALEIRTGEFFHNGFSIGSKGWNKKRREKAAGVLRNASVPEDGHPRRGARSGAKRRSTPADAGGLQ